MRRRLIVEARRRTREWFFINKDFQCRNIQCSFQRYICYGDMTEEERKGLQEEVSDVRSGSSQRHAKGAGSYALHEEVLRSGRGSSRLKTEKQLVSRLETLEKKMGSVEEELWRLKQAVQEERDVSEAKETTMLDAEFTKSELQARFLAVEEKLSEDRLWQDKVDMLMARFLALEERLSQDQVDTLMCVVYNKVDMLRSDLQERFQAVEEKLGTMEGLGARFTALQSDIDKIVACHTESQSVMSKEMKVLTQEDDIKSLVNGVQEQMDSFKRISDEMKLLQDDVAAIKKMVREGVDTQSFQVVFTKRLSEHMRTVVSDCLHAQELARTARLSKSRSEKGKDRANVILVTITSAFLGCTTALMLGNFCTW